jgi:hypothetical protein
MENALLNALRSSGPIDPTIDFPPNFFYKEKYIIEVKI